LGLRWSKEKLSGLRTRMVACIADGLRAVLVLDGLTRAGGGGADRSVTASGRRRLNVICITCDQETYHLAAGDDYQLPARQALKDRGVTFCNHFIAAAMCSPSRAAVLTGQPPPV